MNAYEQCWRGEASAPLWFVSGSLQQNVIGAAVNQSAAGGSVAEWLACWTQAQKGLRSNRSRYAVG